MRLIATACFACAAAIFASRGNAAEAFRIEEATIAGIQQAFQDAVKPVWDKYGPRFADIIKRIQAE